MKRKLQLFKLFSYIFSFTTPHMTKQKNIWKINSFYLIILKILFFNNSLWPLCSLWLHFPGDLSSIRGYVITHGSSLHLPLVVFLFFFVLPRTRVRILFSFFFAENITNLLFFLHYSWVILSTSQKDSLSKTVTAEKIWCTTPGSPWRSRTLWQNLEGVTAVISNHSTDRNHFWYTHMLKHTHT